MNFFLGRKFNTHSDFIQKFNNWMINKCNSRVHGRIPKEMFDLEEHQYMLKLPEQEFPLGQRTVYHDINYNYYSVAFEYVGKIVDIELNHKLVRIYYNGKQIALHELNHNRGQFITIESHYPKFKNYLSTEYQEEYQVKMNKIGSFAGQLFLVLLDKNPYAWNRTAQ